MQSNFDRSLSAVLKHEGGWANHPKDPGGPTNLGITLANYRRYVKPDGTAADLKKLTKEQAAVVYRRQYWDAVRGTELPGGVDYAVFDFAVNSGPRRAIQFLQRVVGTAQDGVLGPKTMKAVQSVDPAKIVEALCSARLKWLQTLKTWPTFGRGWAARVKDVFKVATEMARAPAAEPLEEEALDEGPLEIPTHDVGAEEEFDDEVEPEREGFEIDWGKVATAGVLIALVIAAIALIF
jgi:lysozyme family protein